jgi:hypothetical protein
MRLSSFCFIFSAVCATIGMCLGIWMGVSGDHTLGPTHAHLNVIGWLTMAVFGLYHRGTGRPVSWLDRLQVGTAAVGITGFIVGMTIYLNTTSDTVAAIVFPVGLVGTFLCLGSMVLFLAILIRDARLPAKSIRAVQVA